MKRVLNIGLKKMLEKLKLDTFKALILLLICTMIIPNNLVNTVQRMGQEKKQILMKDNKQMTVNSFLYKNNYKRTMRFTAK